MPVTKTAFDNLAALLKERSTTKGDKVAYNYLQEDSGDMVSLTYAELDAKSTAIAQSLLQKAKKGDRALLLYPSGLEFVCAFFGCLYAGIIAIPAYPPRRNQKIDRIKSIVDDAEASLVLSTQKTAPGARAIFEKSQFLSQAIWIETDSVKTNGAKIDFPEITGEDLAFLQYTSGTTGNPKGVMVSHKNIIENAAVIEAAVEIKGESALMGWLPLFHDMGLIGCILSPLYEGFTATLMSPAAFLKKPVRWLEAMSKTKASRGVAPNFAFDLCVDTIKDEELEGIDLSHWEVAFNGSEPVRASTIERFSERFAKYGFKKEVFYPCYGMAEATLFVTGGKVDQLPRTIDVNRESLQLGEVSLDENSKTNASHVACGTAYRDHKVLVVNPETKTVCAENSIGEIWINGGSIAQGYWNQPELTQEYFQAFTADTKEGPFLRTGDLGFINRNEVFVTGRSKDLLIVLGRNYHPQDIEHTVELSHEDLMKDNTAVFGVDVDGEEKVVVLHGVKRASMRTLSATAIFEAIKTSVAQEHGLLIHDIVLVKPTAILKTSSGKIRRQENKRAYADQELEVLASLKGSTVAKPVTTITSRIELETKLCNIWQQVLGMNKVGVRDNFFDLGGSSLLTVQLTNKINFELGYDMAVTDLFAYPTVSETTQFLLSLDGQIELSDNQITDTVYSEPIAIIGFSGKFPDAHNADEFWDNIRAGSEALHYFSDEELLEAGIPEKLINRPNYVKAGSLMPEQDLFDAGFFGFTPREAQITDPQQRKLLECAYSTLEHAGYGETKNRNVGVFVGVGENRYLFKHLLAHSNLIDSMGELTIFFANGKDYASTRLSYKLNLSGPSINVNTACSSSLVAVHQACFSLLNNECSMALVGSSDFSQIMPEGYLYEEGAIFSPDGHCRPFDKDAKGTRTGSGVGMVLLKRLSEAIADGDTIHSVIKGGAVNNDGKEKAGYTSPSIKGQANVIRNALKAANVDPRTIQYVETHGTGTTLGDPIEIEGLKKGFAIASDEANCAIGSLKGNIGHLFAAAGIASLIKMVQALRHKEIPPSINYSETNPKIKFEGSPFFVNTELIPWKNGTTPRRAGISSFGIGGTNAHLVLEEGPKAQSGTSHRTSQLVALSAKTETALQQMITDLGSHLTKYPETNFTDLAYTLHIGRIGLPFRQSWISNSVEELKEALDTKLVKKVLPVDLDAPEKSVVFMFPGQGAQYVQMTKGLYEEEPVFRTVLDECASLLQPLLGEDIRTLIYPEGDTETASEKLKQTAYTQPVLFSIEYALACLWQSWGVRPSLLIGHSIGEYAAACLAGVFTVKQALKLVVVRGQLIQSIEPGDMLSVQSSIDDIRELAKAEGCDIGAINSPQNCVLSGRAENIAKVQQELETRDIGCRLLETSHAFHSGMMDGILKDFASEFENMELQSPAIPFISNVSGAMITEDEARDPAYWVGHIRNAVDFAAGIDTLLTGDQKVFIEVGPGNTLTALSRKNKKSREHLFASTVRHVQDPVADGRFILKSIGQLWQSGVPINWGAYHGSEKGCRIPLPTYPFEGKRYWIDRKPDESTAAVETEPAGKLKDIKNWFNVPRWERQPASILPSIDLDTEKSNILVFTDEYGIGADQIKGFEKAGQTVITVQKGTAFEESGNLSFTINPESEEDYTRVFDTLAVQEIGVSKVVHLWSLQKDKDPGNDRIAWFEERQKAGFDSFLFAVRAASAQAINGILQFYVVTNNLYSVTGEEDIWPENAPLMSLCKIVPQEYMHMRCQQIDINWPLSDMLNAKEQSRLNQTIFQEINLVPRKTQVALRGKHRWVPRFERYKPQNGNDEIQPIKDNNVYIITGGLGNLGLEMASFFASQANVKIILLGRSVFPDKATWPDLLKEHPEDHPMHQKVKKLLRIEQSGSEVQVLAANVSSKDDMERVFITAEELYGSINGVVHAAGIVKESIRPIKELEIEDRIVHSTPKVNGLFVLDQLLKTRDVDFCLLTSSLSVVLGGPGGSVYSAANSFMDAFVHGKHNQGDSRWVSINWDWWSTAKYDKVEMTDLVSNSNSITPEEGQIALKRLFSFGNIPQVINSLDDLENRVAKWVELTAVKTKSGDANSSTVSDESYIGPEDDTQKKLVFMWQGLLGIEQIGIHDSFFDLGGDSLLVSRLSSMIKQEFSIGETSLPLKSFYENPTIAEISKRVIDAINAHKISDNLEELADSEKVIEEGVI